MKKEKKTNKKVNLYNLFVTRNSCNIPIFAAKHQPINDQSKMQKGQIINFDLKCVNLSIKKIVCKTLMSSIDVYNVKWHNQRKTHLHRIDSEWTT
jgi:hypothetical protein